ncbi:MAG: flagellar hook-associated protein 3 FlgL [Enterococcus sp.]|uniref:flagellin N-terminal helical domain-containing protein n=1 Tax=Enterococcus sp. TaxID=35783 RepID=UPI00258377E7|nr:flagellin [Enterococcus sp.]MDK2844687.1 flagellar hook-associated protein 3 FlgL [Enterococcus sp.]
MRIATNNSYTDFLKNMATTETKLHYTMGQLSSFKEVSKSSEDPLLVSKIMNLNVAIDRNETQNLEIKDAISWSNTQDGILASVSDSMLRIKTLIQSSANTTSAAAEMEANKNEIQQNIEAIVEALNTNFDGRYLFAGDKTTEPPFSVVKNAQGETYGIAYNGSDVNLPREISDGVTVNLVTDGNQLMGKNGAENLNDFFNQVIDSFDNSNRDAMANELLGKADNFRDNFVNVRTKVGSIYNRLKSAQDRNETEKLNLKESLSNRQDVDVAEKYMQFQNEMLAYNATMSMGTKIMQTSILDYVR